MKYAVLIDGGFIRHKLGSRSARMSLAHVRTFLSQLRAHPALADNHLLTTYDIEPNIQQKGVDMRIGLDIADAIGRRKCEADAA
jgi:hypothetical protein